VVIGQTLTADTQTSELRFAVPQADAGGPFAALTPHKWASQELADPKCKLPIPKGLHIALSV